MPTIRQDTVITGRRPCANNPLLTLRASEGAENQSRDRGLVMDER